MANLKRPELKLGGNISEHFKNFEVRFHDYCIQADIHKPGEKPCDGEGGLLQEAFPINIGATIGNARRSFAGDPLHHWTADHSWWSGIHGSGWTNYDFITLDLSEAPYWQTDLNFGTLNKAPMNPFKNGKLRSDKWAAFALTTRRQTKCAVTNSCLGYTMTQWELSY